MVLSQENQMLSYESLVEEGVSNLYAGHSKQDQNNNTYIQNSTDDSEDNVPLQTLKSRMLLKKIKRKSSYDSDSDVENFNPEKSGKVPRKRVKRIESDSEEDVKASKTLGNKLEKKIKEDVNDIDENRRNFKRRLPLRELSKSDASDNDTKPLKTLRLNNSKGQQISSVTSVKQVIDTDSDSVIEVESSSDESSSGESSHEENSSTQDEDYSDTGTSDSEDVVDSTEPLNPSIASTSLLKFVTPQNLRGEKQEVTYEQQKSLTIQKLKEIQETLNSLPKPDEFAVQPKSFKVELKPHQLQGLRFMVWRESRQNPGGIIADEMGLGKTALAIALIASQKHLQVKRAAARRRGKHSGGTLIVAPASLINQWCAEFKKFCKKGALNVLMYHGTERVTQSKTLALKYDVVVTSYALVTQAVQKRNTLYRIDWDRIILDEAHIIRNNKSKQALACFELEAKKRWTLTGTPVQNKELDLFSLIKFMRCTPFNELVVWKRFIGAQRSEERDRLNMLLKSIMLRRTKAELEEAGIIAKLPEKKIIELRVTLTDQEQTVHDVFMSFSQAIFKKFLQQRIETNPTMKQDLQQKGDQIVTNFHRKFQALFHTKQVKQHHILILLLRLRQLVCHPALILNQLPDEHNLDEFSDDDEKAKDENKVKHSDDSSGDENKAGPSQKKLEAFDLIGELGKMIQNGEFDEETEVAESDKAKINCLSRDNPVFDGEKPSTKIRKLLPLIQEKIDQNEKVIIVSVFTSYLDIIANFLHDNGIPYCLFTGKTSISNRDEMVSQFNDPQSKFQVMLLSMKAGSVGLNLTGANNMFILDVFWNPQQELQAMDRIHRFGQVKSVTIIKFICENSIEEHILKIQEKKLAIARSAIDGGQNISNILTIEEMMSMFGMDDPVDSVHPNIRPKKGKPQNVNLSVAEY